MYTASQKTPDVVDRSLKADYQILIIMERIGLFPTQLATKANDHLQVTIDNVV